MDRFLLAENPRTNRGLCIIHTIEPIAIIECLTDGESSKKQHQREYKYINSDGVLEHWTLVVHHLFTANMNNVDDEQAYRSVGKLLDRAWHWYADYLKWEDEQIDNNFL